ncbi:nucleotidyltransferase [Leucothrix pacifica]|nr:nucleotidyltransferase [Leucothrix pacifica]
MSKKQQQIRMLLIREAARLMVEENVTQYLDAKKLAAKRLFRKPLKNLLSNKEVADAVYQMTHLLNAEALDQQLHEMRQIAINVMRELSDFSPRLIGSVSTGRIRESSDIDIHVFVDHIESLLIFLDHLGWRYETSLVSIQQNGVLNDYQHVYLWLDYPIELSVYPTLEIRKATRSSVDRKPIKRLSLSKVEALLGYMDDTV